jgi:hypothetical protein
MAVPAVIALLRLRAELARVELDRDRDRLLAIAALADERRD